MTRFFHVARLAAFLALLPDTARGFHRNERALILPPGGHAPIAKSDADGNEFAVVTPAPRGKAGGTAPFVAPRRFPDMDYLSRKTENNGTRVNQTTRPNISKPGNMNEGVREVSTTAANSTAGRAEEHASLPPRSEAASMGTDDRLAPHGQRPTSEVGAVEGHKVKQQADGTLKQPRAGSPKHVGASATGKDRKVPSGKLDPGVKSGVVKGQTATQRPARSLKQPRAELPKQSDAMATGTDGTISPGEVHPSVEEGRNVAQKPAASKRQPGAEFPARPGASHDASHDAPSSVGAGAITRQQVKRRPTSVAKKHGGPGEEGPAAAAGPNMPTTEDPPTTTERPSTTLEEISEDLSTPLPEELPAAEDFTTPPPDEPLTPTEEPPTEMTQKSEPSGYFRQPMLNDDDMQYTAKITVGGQELDGILDTGSFELLVFSTACNHCGDPTLLYDPAASSTYDGSKAIEKVHHFGSGDCASQLAYDDVMVGEDTAGAQYFWEVNGAKLGGLLYAGAPFQAIVGVGPPNEPKEEAAMKSEVADNMVHQYEVRGEDAPQSILDTRDDNVYLTQQETLTESFGVSLYSVCLGKEPQSTGYFIWNDYDPRDASEGVFTEVRVEGEYHWEVSLMDVSFQGGSGDFESKLACEDGCGAILDSGTSLIVVPNDVADRMLAELNAYPSYDCADLSTFPTLSFDLDGSTFSLPPEAYISVVEGELRDGPLYYKRRNLVSRDVDCNLAVMTMTDETELGPTWIFGMPFFRYFYSTFSLGENPSDKTGRSIFLAPANDQCETPDQDKHMMVQKRVSKAPRKIDLSKAMWPRWLHAKVAQGPSSVSKP